MLILRGGFPALSIGAGLIFVQVSGFLRRRASYWVACPDLFCDTVPPAGRFLDLDKVGSQPYCEHSFVIPLKHNSRLQSLLGSI